MKLRYDAVLLDLDGTIIESSPGIIASIKKTLQNISWDMPAGFDYTKFIGPPIVHSLREFAGMPEEQAKKCVKIYREHYLGGEMFHCRLYPGMAEFIQDIKASGGKVCIATSKPQPMAEKLLDHFEITPLLDYISGADLADEKSNKDELIQRALEAVEVSPERAVMVGDTHFDAAGSRKTNVPFIGVLYGYGSQSSMEAEGASRFVSSVEELRRLILES